MTDEKPSVADPIEVEDLHTFVALLTQWHEDKVALLEHMLDVPEGTEMEHDGASLTLSGENLIAFKAGVSLTLSELGILPFATETAAAPNETADN